MLMVTRDAAEAIQGLVEAPGAEGIRISTAPQSLNGGAPGFRVDLAPAPESLDSVLEAEGARIFLGPGAAEALGDKVLDAELEGDQVRFAVLAQEGPEQP